MAFYQYTEYKVCTTNPGVKVVPSAQVQVDGWPPEPQRFLDNGTMSGCVKSLKTVWLDMHWLLEGKERPTTDKREANY